MNEQLRTKLIAGHLVAVLIWAGFNYNSVDKVTTYETPKPIDAITSGAIATNENSNFIDIEKFEKKSWGRSPFYLSSLNKTTLQITPMNTKTLSWILSGIMMNSSSVTAIINKKPVKIGDTIDKAIVTKIEKDKVLIEYKNQEITLTVSKG